VIVQFLFCSERLRANRTRIKMTDGVKIDAISNQLLSMMAFKEKSFISPAINSSNSFIDRSLIRTGKIDNKQCFSVFFLSAWYMQIIYNCK
jgi:hypothetical protein